MATVDFTTAGMYRDLTATNAPEPALAGLLVERLRAAGAYDGRLHDAVPTPANLAAAPVLAAALEWLTAFAAETDIDYSGLMAAADRWLRWGDWTTQHGSETWRDAFYEKGVPEAFWARYAVVTGRLPEDFKDRFFSCSC
jgi:hypothetical protein